MLVMYDHQTESLWPQILGEAIGGPLKGTQLQPLPHTQTDWATWRRSYPDTKVLSKRHGPLPQRWYDQDPYESYYTSGQTGIVTLQRRSTRLPQKERVIGVRIGPQAKAYAFGALQSNPVINDTFAGQPLVVTYQPSAPTATVFSRRVGDRVLTFAPGPTEAAAKIPILVDAETGSRWSGVTGEALGGPLKGQRLAPVPATLAFWFGWFSFFPDTEVFGP